MSVWRNIVVWSGEAGLQALIWLCCFQFNRITTGYWNIVYFHERITRLLLNSSSFLPECVKSFVWNDGWKRELRAKIWVSGSLNRLLTATAEPLSVIEWKIRFMLLCVCGLLTGYNTMFWLTRFFPFSFWYTCIRTWMQHWHLLLVWRSNPTTMKCLQNTDSHSVCDVAKRC